MAAFEGKRSGERALAVALMTSFVLAVVKYALGLVTGSMLLLWSAADSFSDALVSGVNFWGYRWARTPADREHPFGHGKLEAVLATGQGALLIGIGISVVAFAIKTFVDGAGAPKAALAAIVLLLATATAGFLSWLLTRARRGEASVVLNADAAHYTSDLVAGTAAVLSLVAVEMTGLGWIDPAAAIVGALWTIREGIKVLRTGISELLDEALPVEEQAQIDRVLKEHESEVISFHGLRSRKSGPTRFVEVHVVLPPERSLEEVHRFVQHLSTAIREALPGSRVMIHPDAAGLRDEIDLALEAVDR